ncbi:MULTISPECIES: hypothetical protein [unclassified Beijerinckia]|uniref:hypothetical protein n=1 Tax=unclassified Beijerinckia TaxID=2638183 RepID=UPI00089BF218|nr:MULTISPECIES: hypothetical protein [unclassified Beijerinckia]MDH7794847.1 hypothetical protein [Beijerinckia sp. GAS462]SEB77601.1 hypothetical protein SAMN05443249_1121 [Beijerinckia sp. 28-YEA-48]
MTFLSRHRPLKLIFGAPAVVGGVVAFGLLSALLGDGFWDILSWLALALPILLIAYYALIKS